MSVYTAIVTPFDESGNIDFASFDNLIKFQMNSDVYGIVIFGTTGEAPTLEKEEKFTLLQRLETLLVDNPEYFDKIIVGFSGNSTNRVIKEMSEFSKFKFNKYMLSSPYYNKPTQEGLYQHFTSVMSSFVDKQFVIYNIPSRTGVNILPETIIRICETCDNYFGVKEASGDIDQSKKLIEAGIPTFSGDDIQSHMNYIMGGKGVVSVASNLAPDIVKKYRYDTSKFPEGFLESMFLETNPSPIKYYLKQAGIIKSDYVRLPLVKVSEETAEKLDKFILFKRSLPVPE